MRTMVGLPSFKRTPSQENGKWCVGPLKQTSPCPSDVDCFGGPPVDCQVRQSVGQIGDFGVWNQMKLKSSWDHLQSVWWFQIGIVPSVPFMEDFEGTWRNHSWLGKDADAALSALKSTTQSEASDGFLHSWVFLHFEALLDDLFQRCLSFIPALNMFSKRSPQLSSWEAWERCSTTCGPGQQNRQRRGPWGAGSSDILESVRSRMKSHECMGSSFRVTPW